MILNQVVTIVDGHYPWSLQWFPNAGGTGRFMLAGFPVQGVSRLLFLHALIHNKQARAERVTS